MQARRWFIIAWVAVLAGCATEAHDELDQRFGPELLSRLYHNAALRAHAAGWPTAKSIIDRRCVVCHGCYDAPCQLNLVAYDGLARGASKQRVYDAGRLLPSQPTRLFVDARTTYEWRDRGFFPVLNDRKDTAQANREGSVLYRMLDLKRANPLPAGTRLSEKLFPLGIDRANQCPTLEQMPKFEQQHPLWGMPYALPALSEAEHSTLTRWIEAGSPVAPAPPLTPEERALVEDWEQFLNRTDPKSQLMSRYVYEHLFLADLHFAGSGSTRFFRLVRSRTAPGAPIRPIATRFPYDDPQVPVVYYRLEPVDAAVLAKTHLPYALSPARRARWSELFLDAPYTVTARPDYDTETAANPFITFRDVPLQSRYRFLLDDAQFFIMGFIKGPVCHGQVAINSINDHFWVFFVNPNMLHGAETAQFLADQSAHLRLPAQDGSAPVPLTSWLKYADLQHKYTEARTQLLRTAASRMPITLDLIWNGDGANPNAALTVFRHFDSASVSRGMIGNRPKTALLLSYALFERFHYLLTAGFDVHGNVGHQLNTRLYMDFLRMEGEFNLLALLPSEERVQERNLWYRSAPDEVSEFFDRQFDKLRAETAIPFRSQQPERELFEMIRERLHPVLNTAHDIDTEPDERTRTHLQRLGRVFGAAANRMPEAAVVSLVDTADASGAHALYTVLRNSAHLNVAHLFAENQRRVPHEDTLTVVRGVIGAYPNAFFRVPSERLPEFVDTIETLMTEEDYDRLLTRFGVRRTDPRFWDHSDQVHDAYAKLDPLNAGLLDLNRLENR